MSALVFGQADPRDYMEPACVCGHRLSEHYDPDGASPAPTWKPEASKCEECQPPEYPCWDGWVGDVEGCDCINWTMAGVPLPVPGE